jgi:hypothetical protein
LELARQALEITDENDHVKQDKDISEAKAAQDSLGDATDDAEDPGDTTGPEERT